MLTELPLVLGFVPLSPPSLLCSSVGPWQQCGQRPKDRVISFLASVGGKGWENLLSAIAVDQEIALARLCSPRR